MTDTPLTAPDVNLLANIGYKYALETMTTEQLRARVAELEAALAERNAWIAVATGTGTIEQWDKARAALEGTR